jgi:hypothetical protein
LQREEVNARQAGGRAPGPLGAVGLRAQRHAIQR